MNKQILKIGDKVLVNNNAFDEQFEKMVDPLKIYEVSDVKKSGSGTSGQWSKVKGGIEIENFFEGTINIDNGWIDSAWLKPTQPPMDTNEELKDLKEFLIEGKDRDYGLMFSAKWIEGAKFAYRKTLNFIERES